MADTSGMVLHENRFSLDFYAPNEPGVHVAYSNCRGYFIRWQFESGDSMMGDESFAKTCGMDKDAYLDLMYKKYNGTYFCGLYFDNREDCQRAIDEVIQPAVLADVMGRNEK